MTSDFQPEAAPIEPPIDSTLLVFGEQGCFSGLETAFRIYLEADGRPRLFSGFRGVRRSEPKAALLEPGDELILADIIRLWTEAAAAAPDRSTNHSSFKASGPLAELFPPPFATSSFSCGARTACAWIQAVADGCPPLELCRRAAAASSGAFNPAPSIFASALALWEQRQIAAASAPASGQRPPAI